MAHSPTLARGSYVLLLMVPSSCCFYYVCRHRLGFPRMTACTAAILPNILPMQWQIPAGINMSYVLWGLLVSLVSLILGFRYLENDGENDRSRLAGALLCYLAATQLMEQALFLFPPFVLAFWGYRRFGRKNVYLLTGLAIIAVVRLAQTVVYPRAAAEIQSIPLGEIVRRLSLYVQWSLPFPDVDPVYLALLSVGIISVGCVMYLRRPGGEPTVNRILLYVFLGVWSISTIFVFICMSRDFVPRYVYVSAFGLNAVLVFSVSVIVGGISRGNWKWSALVLGAIIMFSGSSRYSTLKTVYAQVNTPFSIVKRDLEKMQLPLNSQIVIVGVRGISGCWANSSGYLQFALDRQDVSGLVIWAGRSTGYFNFDNHFNPRQRGSGSRYRMTGLSVDQPVFLFVLGQRARELKQLEYLLQWYGEEKSAPWTIVRVDRTRGTLVPFVSGVGMEEYVLAIQRLSRKGVVQSEILWGGPPTEVERRRLGMN